MGKVIEFQTSTGHLKTRNRLKVTVYDSLKDVRKWGKWNADGKPYGENTYGVCNKQTIYDDDNGRPADKPSRIEAYIRLEKDHCPTGLVAHEVAHAAVYFYTQDGNRLHKDSPIEKEELFCYIYGDLFHEVTKKLYKYKIWG